MVSIPCSGSREGAALAARLLSAFCSTPGHSAAQLVLHLQGLISLLVFNSQLCCFILIFLVFALVMLNKSKKKTRSLHYNKHKD